MAGEGGRYWSRRAMPTILKMELMRKPLEARIESEIPETNPATPKMSTTVVTRRMTAEARVHGLYRSSSRYLGRLLIPDPSQKSDHLGVEQASTAAEVQVPSLVSDCRTIRE